MRHLDIKKKVTTSKVFNQKAKSALAKWHTTLPESLKGGLKDFQSRTLPIRFSILQQCNMRYFDIKERTINIVKDVQSKRYVNFCKVTYNHKRTSEKGFQREIHCHPDSQ